MLMPEATGVPLSKPNLFGVALHDEPMIALGACGDGLPPHLQPVLELTDLPVWCALHQHLLRACRDRASDPKAG